MYNNPHLLMSVVSVMFAVVSMVAVEAAMVVSPVGERNIFSALRTLQTFRRGFAFLFFRERNVFAALALQLRLGERHFLLAIGADNFGSLTRLVLVLLAGFVLRPWHLLLAVGADYRPEVVVVAVRASMMEAMVKASFSMGVASCLSFHFMFYWRIIFIFVGI